MKSFTRVLYHRLVERGAAAVNIMGTTYLPRL
jgi:hypothetical protein